MAREYDKRTSTNNDALIKAWSKWIEQNK
jgi:hypothetical protein